VTNESAPSYVQLVLVHVLDALVRFSAGGIDAIRAVGSDEGPPPLNPANLLYTENPYRYKKCQWRMTVRPRIPAQVAAAEPPAGLVNQRQRDALEIAAADAADEAESVARGFTKRKKPKKKDGDQAANALAALV
jgi:hypothetical protein